MAKKEVSISFLAELRERPAWKKNYVNKRDSAIKGASKLETWYVYVCASENRHPTKIGISKNLRNRLIQLQDGCSSKLQFYFVIPFPTKRDAYEVEQQVLHSAKYLNYRLYGEWMNRGVDWVINQALAETKHRDLFMVGRTLARSGLSGY